MNTIAFIRSLSGYKTYILGALLIGYLFGANQGWWVMDGEIAGILAALGGIALRAGVTKVPATSPAAPSNTPSNPGITPAFAGLALASALLLQTGCSSVAPGNDPVVVSAERTTQLALDTFDTFLKWELENRQLLSQWPEIRESADQIRLRAPGWIVTVRTLTKVYKSNRNQENEVNLDTALAVLRTAIKEALGHITAANSRNATASPL